MTAACPHGYPSPASCIDCMDEGGLPPAPPPTPDTVAFHARFSGGHCPKCRLAIEEGDLIRGMTDGTWWHAECTDQSLLRARQADQ